MLLDRHCHRSASQQTEKTQLADARFPHLSVLVPVFKKKYYKGSASNNLQAIQVRLRSDLRKK